MVNQQLLFRRNHLGHSVIYLNKTWVLAKLSPPFAVEAGQVKIKGRPEDLGSFINNLLGKMGLGTHSDIMQL